MREDATELSVVVIALSAPSGQRVASILDTSPLNRTNCDKKKIGEQTAENQKVTIHSLIELPEGHQVPTDMDKQFIV